MSSLPSSTSSTATRQPDYYTPQNINARPTPPFRPPHLMQHQQPPPPPMMNQQQYRPIFNDKVRPIQRQQHQQQQQPFAQPSAPVFQQQQLPSVQPLTHSSGFVPRNAAQQLPQQLYATNPIEQTIPQSTSQNSNSGLITPINKLMSNMTLDKNGHHASNQQTGRSRRVYAALDNPKSIPSPTATTNHSVPSSTTFPTSGGKTPLGMPTRPILKPRIDPNAIPSPIQSQMKKNEERLQSILENQQPNGSFHQHHHLTGEYVNNGHYLSEDQRQQLNCHSQIMQPTLPCIPDSENLIRDTELPFGIVLQPYYSFAKATSIMKEEVPVLKKEELIRCTRCKGYINGFCQINSTGFICNLCGFENKDIVQLKSNSIGDVSFPSFELMSNGTVEFDVPKEYWATNGDEKGSIVKPVPLHWLVAIDVTKFAVQSGIVHTICNILKEWIQKQKEIAARDGSKNNIKIAIMTFDKTLHFYDLRKEQPSIMVVSDLDDVYVPMSTDHLFIDSVEASTTIEALLERLPTLYETTMITHAAFGAAVQCAYAALKSTGGKTSIVQTTLPSIGPSSSILKNRDDPSLYGTEREKSLFLPQDKSTFYKQMGTAYAESGISIDLWCFPPNAPDKHSYIDLATIGVLSALTGGDIHFYPNFSNSSNDPYAPPLTPNSDNTKQQDQIRRVTHDLTQSIQRKQGYSAMLRLRCSNGLSVGEHYGNFYMSNATDIQLANINENTCIGITLKHDSKLPANQPVYFQCAVLYTTVDGHRRVRVHNLCLQAGSSANAIFKSADLDVSMTFHIKRMISQVTAKKSLNDNGSALDNLAIHILSAYRKYCAPDASPAQLILPEQFKNMPLLCSALKKSILLRKDTKINVDTRLFNMRKMKGLSVPETSQWLYPQCIPLHIWFEQLQQQQQQQHPSFTAGTADSFLSTFLLTPPLERLSYDRFDTKGIYWIHSHDTIFLWIGHEAPASIVNGLFSPSTTDPVQSIVTVASNDDTDSIYNALLRKLYQQSISATAYLPSFQIVRQGVDLEVSLAHVLVEDAIYQELSYVDYLCLLHKQIQLELEREKQQSAISAASYWAHRY
ncbi:Sec23/Sec24 trunk domain-containing protein [Mycotypha africana]|uniref:Sec23/Sec24 trunk domain-containing protein n=1 Tax=Mycotypha africana TaxID=64632 RepID=UPI0023004C75|nr:Sec23/Sec24 trunk domain-containing protein [Mycotypha africana]KAI8966960.1 Sec23/Sec24 trunk domain-containing protein [Mycotypha africana]